MCTRSITLLRWAAGLLLLSTSACGRSDAVVSAEDQALGMAALRLTVGTSSVVVRADGKLYGGPLRISRALDSPFTGFFLKADGTPDAKLSSQSGRTFTDPFGNVYTDSLLTYGFEVFGAAGIEFTRDTQAGATVTGVIRAEYLGQHDLGIVLINRIESRAEFGPFSVPIRVE